MNVFFETEHLVIRELEPEDVESRKQEILDFCKVHLRLRIMKNSEKIV